MRRLVILLALLSSTLPSSAQTGSDLVGRWCGELAIKNNLNVDSQRWIRVTRSDGTQTVTFRFYRGNSVVGELVRNDVWSFANGIYRTECRSSTVYGRPMRCEEPHEYIMHRLNSLEMEYTHRASGTHFRAVRCDGISSNGLRKFVS
jgi:hypothetical protein